MDSGRQLPASRKSVFCCVKNYVDYTDIRFLAVKYANIMADKKSDVLDQKNGVVFAVIYDNPLMRVVNTF